MELPSMASRSRSTRLAPVVMAVAAAVVDMEAAAVDMVVALEVVDMEVVDMVEMVATEEAVEAAATVVAAVDMEVVAVATEVDVVVEDTVAVATRPPPDQTLPSKRSIFDLRFPFMHISYYSAMQYCQPKSVFFLHLISDHFS